MYVAICKKQTLSTMASTFENLYFNSAIKTGMLRIGYIIPQNNIAKGTELKGES